MRARIHETWTWALLVGAAMAMRASTGLAAFEFTDANWDSAHKFLELAREELGRDRVVLGARIDWNQLTEKDAVLLLHPQSNIDATEASSFVSAGGRLAVVDDFGKGDQLLARFHIQRTPAPKPSAETHRDNPNLMLARPVVTETGARKPLKHPMVVNVDHVVTNHPTAYATASHVELTPVLTLRDTSGTEALFAVIGVIGDGKACGLEDGSPRDRAARCGRLFAMADSSVFIDLMMRFDGNRALAKGLVNYLVESDAWGARQGMLYILTNSFDQTGHFGGRSDFARELDRVVDNLESMLDDTRKEGLPKQWTWMLAILAALGTAAFAWQSSGRLYQRPTPRYARGQPRSAQAGAAGRAAVLAAPTTHGTLVLLELKAAAEEYLRARLGLPSTASSAGLLETLRTRHALEPSLLERLSGLFAQMERAEKSLLGAESLRIRPESIRTVHQGLAEILPRVEGVPAPASVDALWRTR
jgi:hypothetical protein